MVLKNKQIVVNKIGGKQWWDWWLILIWFDDDDDNNTIWLVGCLLPFSFVVVGQFGQTKV